MATTGSYPRGLQIRTEIKGIRQTVQALEKLGDDMQKALAKAGAAGAEIVAEHVDERVPKLTGLLASAMQSAVGIEPDRVRIWIGIREDMDVPGYGDPAEYGSIIEDKGSPAGRGKGFMKRSAKDASTPVVQAIVAILRAAATGNVFRENT